MSNGVKLNLIRLSNIFFILVYSITMNYEALTHLSKAQPEINGTSLITYLVAANTDM
jgi:hypothetical protein